MNDRSEMAESDEPAFSDSDYEDFSLMVRQHGAHKAEARWVERGARWGDRGRAEREAAALRAAYEDLARSAQLGYPPRIIAGPREPWYAGPLQTDTFWPSLHANLKANPALSDDAVQAIDEASTKILAYTHEPNAQKWLTKGLVVGHVQSGKTTNFLAVATKAVDLGYNLVIILSGIHNGLRSQTQHRAEAVLEDRAGWAMTTTTEDDFRKPSMTLESMLPGHGDRKAVLCVVKKNQSVLTKLVTWIGDAKRAGGLRNVKALIIDDEADQASVETAKINPSVRALLDLLPRRTYIGYTATPFANVLIDPKADDLYPEDFILALPEPDGYFGPTMIFGRDSIPHNRLDPGEDGFDMVRTVPADEALKLVPVRGRPFEPEITPNLERAVLWFWLATAARRAMDDHGAASHSTMLVHTSMRTDAHAALSEPIREFRAEIRGRLAIGDPDLLAELEQLWDDETVKVTAEAFGNQNVSFGPVLAHLESVVDSTRIVQDNSRSDDRLDYPENDPVTVIAIGGNTLSRGLTLNGLVVSFFVRAARAYDTLLQMGRWFGFRPGYEHLCRIYMTDELKRWFRHLAAVEYELRQEIERYEDQDMTPQDTGVRIRTHPQMAVTNKLGAARQAYTSYGGRRVQTRYFRTDRQWLRGNLLAASSLVASIGAEGLDPEGISDGSLLWREVPHHHVLDFLREYQTHEDSPDLHRELLTDYISTEIGNGSLDRWSVAIVGNPLSTAPSTLRLADTEVGTIVRARLRDTGEPADIKTLMSKEDRVIDLAISRTEARRQPEEHLQNLRNADPVHKKQGLLVLYPIDRVSEPDESHENSREAIGAEEHIIGIGLVFPGNAKDTIKNSYISTDTSAIEPLEEPEDLSDLISDDHDTPGSTQN